ncbi:MAG: hypothetical protein QOF37_1347 [Thermoleophilaceae bacterium]|jgi:hypothetical protein|nr:hypothetical protein [Thermoleophilaceae bacterium]
MLLREDGDAVICIGQPAHAWLSGQLARAWALDPVEPRDQVVLATEQHDLGMAAWDAAPELNPGTGLPQSFMEMDLETHLQLWTAAPQRMLPQSRYAAVLVSMHGEALYEMRDLSAMDDEDAEAVRDYLAAQAEFQERAGGDFDQGQLRRNQRLIWIWDSLSLGLCLRWEGEFVEEVSLAPGTIEPWPFRDAAVTLRTEGRRLEGTFDDEALMRAALDAAPWVELEFELSRG